MATLPFGHFWKKHFCWKTNSQ